MGPWVAQVCPPSLQQIYIRASYIVPHTRASRPPKPYVSTKSAVAQVPMGLAEMSGADSQEPGQVTALEALGVHPPAARPFISETCTRYHKVQASIPTDDSSDRQRVCSEQAHSAPAHESCPPCTNSSRSIVFADLSRLLQGRRARAVLTSTRCVRWCAYTYALHRQDRGTELLYPPSVLYDHRPIGASKLFLESPRASSGAAGRKQAAMEW